jgi:hypothetical protein
MNDDEQTDWPLVTEPIENVLAEHRRTLVVDTAHVRIVVAEAVREALMRFAQFSLRADVFDLIIDRSAASATEKLTTPVNVALFIADHRPDVGETRKPEAERAEHARNVVRGAFADVARMSGETFAQRHVEDVATRVANKLSREGHSS